MPLAPPRACLVPGCTGLAHKRGRCSAHLVDFERTREGSEPWRAWYRSARWLRLRALLFAREPLCRACLTQGRTVPATEVDHVHAHRGNPTLFWSWANLQPLCASCHSTKTRREQHG